MVESAHCQFLGLVVKVDVIVEFDHAIESLGDALLAEFAQTGVIGVQLLEYDLNKTEEVFVNGMAGQVSMLSQEVLDDLGDQGREQRVLLAVGDRLPQQG